MITGGNLQVSLPEWKLFGLRVSRCEPSWLRMSKSALMQQNLSLGRLKSGILLATSTLQHSWGVSRVPALAPSVREICRRQLLQRETKLQQRCEGRREVHRCACRYVLHLSSCLSLSHIYGSIISSINWGFMEDFVECL